MDDDPEPVVATVRDYYEALRRGEPLEPYFHEHAATTKVGVSEQVTDYEAVAETLREQTRLTTDWQVRSRDLVAGRRGEMGWFSDRVTMAWTREGERLSFETRWSGALVQRGVEEAVEEWPFVELHVSAAHDLAAGAVDDGADRTGADR
jgi:hypothetical protein